MLASLAGLFFCFFVFFWHFWLPVHSFVMPLLHWSPFSLYNSFLTVRRVMEEWIRGRGPLSEMASGKVRDSVRVFFLVHNDIFCWTFDTRMHVSFEATRWGSRPALCYALIAS